jgi:ABC-type enterobactin transport system permease subunit
MRVRVHVPHVAMTAVATMAAMPATLVSSSSPPMHAPHVFVRLHRRAAVTVLASKNHAATAD